MDSFRSFIGFIILFIAGVFWWLIEDESEQRKKNCTEEVMAEVYDYWESRDEDWDCELQCRYAYNGETYTAFVWRGFKTKAEAEAAYPIGSKVPLYIDPQKPGRYSVHQSPITNKTDES